MLINYDKRKINMLGLVNNVELRFELSPTREREKAHVFFLCVDSIFEFSPLQLQQSRCVLRKFRQVVIYVWTREKSTEKEMTGAKMFIFTIVSFVCIFHRSALLLKVVKKNGIYILNHHHHRFAISLVANNK